MNFDKYKPAIRKPNERNYWFMETVQKLNGWPRERVGWWLKGWNAEGIRSMYLASESLAKETGEPFSKFWFWQYNNIKDQLTCG